MKCNFTGMNPCSRVFSFVALIALMTLSNLPVLAHQDQRITLNVSNKTLKNVFHSIEEQAEIVIFYDMDAIDENEKVSLNVKDLYVEDVLNKLLANKTSLKWNRKGNVVRIYVSYEVKSLGDPVVDPPVSISGKVTDESGVALPGATVLVKGTKMGTSTDVEGKFVLANVPANGSLMISYTSYEPKEVSVRGQKSVVVGLKKIINNLDETVIMGYGTTTKRLNVGNISTVKGEDIEKQPVSNPLSALQGRISGMEIYQSTGMPGSAYSVKIRGQNSLNNGNDPLYIIDGVPYTAQLITNINPVRGGNPLNFINPYDIESIDVLKDADATAIYGSRGANGVVLITTKKGKVGAMNFNFNVYTGGGKVTRKMDLLNTSQYLMVRKEAFKNDGISPSLSNAPDLLLWDTTRYTDWQKVLLGNTAHYTDAQASVSGGNTNTQYLIGGGYHRETTVLPGNSADQKTSIHFAINSSSSNQKFKMQLSGNYIVDNNNLVSNDFVTTALSLPPDAPSLYNTDGTLNWENTAPGLSGTWSNPLAILENKYMGYTNNLVSNAMISYNIFPDLEIKSSFGYTNLQVNEKTITPTTSFDPGYNITSGNSQFSAANINSWIIEPQVNYKIRLSKGTLATLVGTTFQQNNNDGQQYYAEGFSSDAFLENIHAASQVIVGTTTNLKYKYSAIFGRLNYNWNDKYIVNFTARRDGTSRFGPDKQFANFGAVGAAWIFSKENFVQSTLPFISFGKLRASYGSTGNDQIPDYQFLDLYMLTSYSYQGIQGLYPTKLFNSDLAWEVNRKFELGLELGFMKDRVTFNLSYYRNRSSNQLLDYTLSAVTGFNSIKTNLQATNQNSGIEILLNTISIKTKDFKWSTSANLTMPRNKLISFPGLETSSYSNSYIVGLPISILKRYHLIGVDNQTGQFQYADNKGNPSFTPSSVTDRNVILNSKNSYYYGGIQNEFQFKQFSLDILFQFVHKTGIPFLYSVLPGGKFNQPVAVLNRWQNSGDISAYPKYSQNFRSPIYRGYRDYFTSSDGNISNGSFIRLKNISFSYNLDNKFLQRVHLKGCRIYIQGHNLLTITKYKGLDPENQSQALPPLRVLTAGIQISL